MPRGRSTIARDNLTALAVVGITVAFVLWQQKQKKAASIGGAPLVGVRRNPKHLRPGDVEGFQRFTTLPTAERERAVRLMSRYDKANLQASLNRAAQYLRKKRVTVGAADTSPGLIGCDCGTEF